MMISVAELLHKYLFIIVWLLWIFCGAMFYEFHDGYTFHVALYKSVSIGWSIGWTLPYDTDLSDKAGSMVYSCFHNVMGAMFTGLVVIIIAERVVANTDDWMVEITRKRSILKLRKMSPTFKGKSMAALRLHKTTVELVALCFCFGFCGVLMGVSLGHNTWTIAKSMDLTLSTLCTCGYLGLPAHALPWKYIVTSIYTNLGVPCLSIGLGALIAMFIVNPNEIDLYKKISAPLTHNEIAYMKSFGIEDGDGFISRKEFTMLTIIRIGRVEANVIRYIRHQFQDLLEFHGGNIEKRLLSYEHLKRVSTKSFSLWRILPFGSNDDDSNDDDNLSIDEELGFGGPVTRDHEVDTEENVEDQDEFFENEGCPKVPEVKRLSLNRKISDMSLRNLKHSRKTIKQLERVKKENEKILMKAESTSSDDWINMKAILLYIHHLPQSGHFRVMVTWVMWLCLAGLFYSVKKNISYMKGFYIGVSVGYSIYWTTDESDPGEKAFSVINLLIGQVFMGILMAVLASNVIITKQIWYGEELLKEKLKTTESKSNRGVVSASNGHLFKAYIFLSLLSRWGGIWPIPEDSPDSFYFFVGIYTAFGAPILVLNTSIAAEYVAHLGNSYLLRTVIYRPVDNKEVEYMQRVGMEDGSGELDEQEYVLLTLIRLKALPHDLVSTIVEMFNILDENSSGNIPYDDIVNQKLTSTTLQSQRDMGKVHPELRSGQSFTDIEDAGKDQVDVNSIKDTFAVLEVGDES